MTANFLQIEPLLDITSAKIASLIQRKNNDDIKQELGIIKNINNLQKNKIIEDNNWIKNI